jgi:hypothetical protein
MCKSILQRPPGGKKLPEKPPDPLSGGYKPEPVMVNQSQIGILRWCMDMVHIDTITEVSMVSTYLCFLREGNLYTMFCVFAYLLKHHNVPYAPCYS